MNRERIHKKIRAKVKGTAAMPRLAVFRSSKYIYAQVINDDAAVTICAASDAAQEKTKKTKAQRAREVGVAIAKLAKKEGIEKVVFDRGGFQYHGRIKEVAEGAREGGLVL